MQHCIFQNFLFSYVGTDIMTPFLNIFLLNLHRASVLYRLTSLPAVILSSPYFRCISNDFVFESSLFLYFSYFSLGVTRPITECVDQTFLRRVFSGRHRPMFSNYRNPFYFIFYFLVFARPGSMCQPTGTLQHRFNVRKFSFSSDCFAKK